MEITQRELVTVLHGMLFGGFFLMAAFGAAVLFSESGDRDVPTTRAQAIYLVVAAAVGWAAVLSGAYVVYPWYRAAAPAGADLALYPKAFLTLHPSTAGWHTFGMEWKEHVAWIAPMAMTMVAFIFVRHRRLWNASRSLRGAVLGFTGAAFLAAALAGSWGALIDKVAAVRGGPSIQLMRSRP